MSLIIRNLLCSYAFCHDAPVAVVQDLEQLIRDSHYEKAHALIHNVRYEEDLPPKLSAMIREGVFSDEQLIILDQEIMDFSVSTGRWFDAISFVIESNNKMLLNQLFQKISILSDQEVRGDSNGLFKEPNVSRLLKKAIFYPDIFSVLLSHCEKMPSLRKNPLFWNNLLFTSLQAPLSLSILWEKVPHQEKESLICETDLLLKASATPESLRVILQDVSPKIYSSVITERSLLYKIVAYDISRLTAILSHVPKEDRFNLLSEKNDQGDSVLDSLKPEQRSSVLALLRPDIAFVLKEKYRLKDNATHFFSIGNNKKIQLIDKSLEKALNDEKQSPEEHRSVIETKEMKAALSHHRIFGFFGLKKTIAINHLESFELEKPQQRF